MVIETETGYAVRLSDDPSTVYEAFELALLERRCCPFLRLDFTIEPNDGPIWLTLSGGPGVKAFLAASSLMGGKARIRCHLALKTKTADTWGIGDPKNRS